VKITKFREHAQRIDDNAWFKEIEKDGDKLCEEFNKIVQEKI
jgi:hypothetical protein